MNYVSVAEYRMVFLNDTWTIGCCSRHKIQDLTVHSSIPLLTCKERTDTLVGKVAKWSIIVIVTVVRAT